MLKFNLIVFYLKNSYIFVLNKQIEKMKQNLEDFVIAVLFMCTMLALTILILNYN